MIYASAPRSVTERKKKKIMQTCQKYRLIKSLADSGKSIILFHRTPLPVSPYKSLSVFLYVSAIGRLIINSNDATKYSLAIKKVQISHFKLQGLLLYIFFHDNKTNLTIYSLIYICKTSDILVFTESYIKRVK